MLYVDLPTLSDLRDLAGHRHEASVSLYLATTPQTQHIGEARTRLVQLLKEAEAQLEAAGTAKRTIWPISEQVNDLVDDDDFWQKQANGLAILVTPDRLLSFRLPTKLTDTVQVSDRFHLKPLMRVVSFPQAAYVLALEENRVRLVEVSADLAPHEVKIPDMPRDAAQVARTANVNSRSASGRIHGDEGQNVRLRQYVRRVDEALRPFLAGREEPLILAATDPMLSYFRSTSTYPRLAAEAIVTSPVRMSEADLAAAARPLLDKLHADRLAETRALYAARGDSGRATTDVADAARAATAGAVEVLMVDIDRVVPGTVDDAGAVTFADASGADSYGVIDEIAGRVLLSGGTVVGARAADLPGDTGLAAILRFAV
jgi:hypothetical protein